jgi:hypothetical protein
MIVHMLVLKLGPMGRCHAEVKGRYPTAAECREAACKLALQYPGSDIVSLNNGSDYTVDARSPYLPYQD